jgi:penicillin-binding protein 2
MSSFDLFGNSDDSAFVGGKQHYDMPGFVLPMEESEDKVETEQVAPRHFAGLTLMILVILTVLGVQCYRLQVIQARENQSLAEGNSLRIITLPADRGLIVDQNNKVLAQNTRQLALAINPQTLPAKRVDRQAVYAFLQKKAGIDDKTISLIENNRSRNPEVFPIKTGLTKDESLLYKEWFGDTPGVVTQEIPIRSYAALPSLGHLLGYVGSASTQSELDSGLTLGQQVGKTGLEQVYTNTLSGTPGKQRAVVNAFGEIVNNLASPDVQAKPGQTLKLSIDSDLQKITTDALTHELERRQKKFGDLKQLGASAVILDPTTGAVKAMVSLPDYDPNTFAQGISQKDYSTLVDNPANPLLNRTIQGEYPSGSVIKPLIAAGGLQSGVIKPDTQLVTPEAIYVGNFRFPDWKTHGLTNTRKAIAESNDIFFYAVGGGWKDQGITGLGIDTMNSYLRSFGLGTSVGIDLPSETSGLIADNAWKEKNIGEPWYIGDTYHSSIGQGYTLVTPLQMAVSTAAVVNGGTVWQPKIAWSELDPLTGHETLLPHTVLKKDFISTQNLQVVREGMRQTVQTGSAHPLNTLKVTSAGKTGTAEFGNKGLTHAWYTGFAPYENPEIVFSILIEGGGDSYYSSVPVAEEILRNYFHDPLAPGQKLNSEPDLTNSEFQGEH